MNRLYHIDLLRFIAAFMVVLHHYCFRGGYWQDYLSFNYEEYSILYAISKYGFLGVEFFFILSGFVITQSLIRSNNAFDFIFNRVVRIYPAYLFCCIFTFTILAYFKPLWFDLSFFDLIYNISFVNFPLRYKNVDEVYWTLHLEILFYFWCSLIILTCSDKIKGMKFFFLISFVFYFIDVKFLSQIFISKYISFFFLGFAICYFKNNYLKSRYYSYSLFIISLIISMLSISNEMISVSKVYQVNFRIDVALAMVLLTSALLIFDIPVENARVKKIFLKLGSISYPLYLLHQNLGYLMLDELVIYYSRITSLSITIIAILFLSYLVSVFIEPHISHFFKDKMYNWSRYESKN